MTPLPTPIQIPPCVPSSSKPFNPFSESDATSTAAIQPSRGSGALNTEGLLGLERAAPDLGEQLAKGGVDKWNEGLVVLSTLASESKAMGSTAVAIGLGAAEKSAKSTSDFIASNWDDIAGFGADLSTEIGSSASELAEDFFTAWEEAEEEAEEIAEAAAQAVEETVEDIIETVEDIVEETSESTDDVVEWVCSFIC